MGEEEKLQMYAIIKHAMPVSLVSTKMRFVMGKMQIHIREVHKWTNLVAKVTPKIQSDAKVSVNDTVSANMSASVVS